MKQSFFCSPLSFLSPLAIGAMHRERRDVVVLSDPHVAPLYAAPLVARLSEVGCRPLMLVLEGGEGGKTREGKAHLEDQMQEEGYGEVTTLIGIGGGVVTDMAGFLASTYCRGIALSLIPTSLLGMVDAAIGGKNGVNTLNRKNGVGTVYSPQTICIDPSLLATLPEREYRHGYAEIVKLGLVADGDLFRWAIEEMQRGGRIPFALIDRSISLKERLVTRSVHRKSRRNLLNFGHTIAHALESLTHYQMPHGEAVARGILLETWISHLMGALSRSHCLAIVNALEGTPFLLN
ncbi:MAG: 3-dehydroquinate synthase family protein, partial [Chlamydiota bacterium]|nr:3-dehydroquinate synthase family protein [Chlamydiota bacterium]